MLKEREKHKAYCCGGRRRRKTEEEEKKEEKQRKEERKDTIMTVEETYRNYKMALSQRFSVYEFLKRKY